MGTFNVKALRDEQERLEKGSGGSDTKYFSQKDISGECVIRIIPDVHDELDGLYYIEEKGFWIGGQRVVSPSTFGDDCELTKKIHKLQKTGDKSEKALLKQSKEFSEKSTYLLPILKVNITYKKDGETIKTVEVEDDEVKIFQCGITIIKEINKILTNRQFQVKNTDYGPLDPEQGFCLILTKKGKELKTEYSVMPIFSSIAMDEKYYDPEVVPSLVTECRNKIKDEDEALEILEQYLYGDDSKPKSKAKKDDDDDDDYKPKSKLASKTSKAKKDDDGEEDDEEDDEEDTPKSKAKKTEPKKPIAKKRVMEDDEEDDEDDDEEDDEDDTPKSKGKKIAPKKPIAKKRVINDDEEEEEDDEEDDEEDEYKPVKKHKK